MCVRVCVSVLLRCRWNSRWANLMKADCLSRRGAVCVCDCAALHMRVINGTTKWQI